MSSQNPADITDSFWFHMRPFLLFYNENAHLQFCNELQYIKNFCFSSAIISLKTR